MSQSRQRTATDVLDALDMDRDDLVSADEAVAARKAAAGKVPFPHTVCHEGETISLFQDVHEHVENPLDDNVTIVWTVCSLTENEALLKDTESWSRREWVDVEQLLSPESDYEAQWLEDDKPHYGY